MRTKKIMLVKMILAVVLVASAVLGLTPDRASKVSATSYKPKSSTTESTTESSTADNNINDLNVSMDSNGQIQTSFDSGNGDSTSTWNTIFARYKVIITGISGLATLTFLILFIISMIKLAGCADNPTERRKVLSGVLWQAVALALSGSATLICGLAWNALK
jgi:hypothetical protein